MTGRRRRTRCAFARSLLLLSASLALCVGACTRDKAEQKDAGPDAGNDAVDGRFYFADLRDTGSETGANPDGPAGDATGPDGRPTDACAAECKPAPACGDGHVDPGETCDDGNTVSGDGCDGSCKPTGCGNGVVTAGEACDDGNTIGGDGCRADCKGRELCGDRLVDVGEACDDGNTVSGDGCRPDCKGLEVCGDKLVDVGELCDDGNAVSGDGCDTNCKPTGCGNGIVTTGEICDDGNAVSGDGCDTNCKPTGCGNGVVTAGEICDDGNAASGDGCDTNCKPTGCGNGVVTAGEICDDGNTAAGDGCRADCKGRELCGDKLVDVGEICDDGNTTSGDGCRADCKKIERCGDAALDSGEICDDGNTVAGDGCRADCKGREICGDKLVDVGEVCDDGNTASGDGCRADCKKIERCGDAALDSGEICDDGNAVGGDGCRADCKGREKCGDGLIDVGEVCLEAPAALPTGDWPQHVVAVDINGDGIADILSANMSTYTLAVLLGRGDGTFAPMVEYPATKYASRMALGDFDGDGRLDAALVGYFGGEFAILYGRGDGSFEAPRAIKLQQSFQQITAGDLDGDGTAELVATDGMPEVVVWRFGPTRTPAYTQIPSIDGLGSPILRDFNKDGRLDLGALSTVVNSTTTSYVVWQGKGDRTFMTTTAGTPVNAGTPTVADVDRDGNLDVAIAGSAGPTLLYGNGDGTFAPPAVVGTSIGSPADIQVADLDGDGLPDLAVSNVTALAAMRSLSVFLANGDGTFAEGIRFDAFTNPFSFAVLDADRDGVLDLAVTSGYSLVLDLFRGRGDGTFRAPGVAIISADEAIGDVALPDLNEDGRPDMVTVDHDHRVYLQVVVALGRGDGTFAPQVAYPTSAPGMRVTTGDLDGDGHQDVIVSGTILTPSLDDSSVWRDKISVLFGRGDGTLDPEQVLTVDNQPVDTTMMDMNHDGRVDIIVASAHGAINFIKNMGSRTFDVTRSIATPGVGPMQAAVADFNRDGHPDVAAGGINGGQASGWGGVVLVLGNGDGTFQARTIYTGEQAYSLRAGDFNGDGFVDIATTNPASDTVAVFLGNGNGTFQARQVTPVMREASEPLGLTIVDFNRDGALDLVTGNCYGASVTVLLGDGKGKFPFQRSFGADMEPIGVAVSDIDGDSLLDLAVTSFRAGRIMTYRGLPP